MPLALGVWIRVHVQNFLAADISLEATALLGPAAGAGGCGVRRGGAGAAGAGGTMSG